MKNGCRHAQPEESRDIEFVDGVLSLIKEHHAGDEFKFDKSCIGLATNDRPDNFVTVIPAKKRSSLQPLSKQSNDIDKMIEDGGLEISHVKGWKRYRSNFSASRCETINPLGRAATLADELRNW